MAVSTTSPTPRGSRATSGPPVGLAPPGEGGPEGGPAGGPAAGGGPPPSSGPSGSGGATEATGLRSGGHSDSAAANGRSLREKSVEALIRSNCTRGAHTTRCSGSRQSPRLPAGHGRLLRRLEDRVERSEFVDVRGGWQRDLTEGKGV